MSLGSISSASSKLIIHSSYLSNLKIALFLHTNASMFMGSILSALSTNKMHSSNLSDLNKVKFCLLTNPCFWDLF